MARIVRLFNMWGSQKGEIKVPNIISPANSTTTPLNAGQTFTGAWEDVTIYNSVVVAVKTDQDGTFKIEFSPDGVNIDSTLTRYYRTSQIEAPHRFTITRQYVRITFENTSASNQTFMRLQTTYGEKADLNAPLDQTLAQDFDSTVVRPSDYRYEVALGLRQGATTWNKFGYNDDVDVGTETIWSVGGTFVPLTTARTLSVVSTSADDDSGGTGANSIVITGVDANYESLVEVVTMNGTTPVVTTGEFLGVNRMAVFLAGSGFFNAGDITATATTDLTVQGQIPTNSGTTQQAFFFTQANHTALLDFATINCVKIAGGGGSPVVSIRFFVRSLISNGTYEVFRESIDTAVENTVIINTNQPFVIDGSSLLYAEATTDTNNTEVSVRFSLIEFRDVNA